MNIRMTDPKPVVLRARAPLTLAAALKTVADRRDMTLAAVVRQALAAGVRVMLEAEDKTEVTT